MSLRDRRLQHRLLAACRAWLDWCSARGEDPLSPDVDQLRRAASDMKSQGATAEEVVDLVDQVGFMTGVWRTSEWLDLRRKL